MSGTWADAGLRMVWTDFPERDEIGDPLRADTVAYWKMDEASGTRIDATGRGNNLTDNNAVGSVAGKVASAASFSSVSSQGLSINSNSDLDLTGTDFAITGWFRMTDPADSYYVVISKLDPNAVGADFEVAYYYPGAPGLEWLQFTVVTAITYPFAWDTNWHFFVAYYKINVNTPPASSRIGLSVDNGTFAAMDYLPDVNHVVPIYVGTDTYDEVSHLEIDELCIVKRTSSTSDTVLTSDEINYLYNSGNGRTLYP